MTNTNSGRRGADPVIGRNWEEGVGQAQVDHLLSESIDILACHEYEQNGPSDWIALA